jgi:hypothetical protein
VSLKLWFWLYISWKAFVPYLQGRKRKEKELCLSNVENPVYICPLKSFIYIFNKQTLSTCYVSGITKILELEKQKDRWGPCECEYNLPERERKTTARQNHCNKQEEDSGGSWGGLGGQVMEMSGGCTPPTLFEGRQWALPLCLPLAFPIYRFDDTKWRVCREERTANVGYITHSFGKHLLSSKAMTTTKTLRLSETPAASLFCGTSNVKIGVCKPGLGLRTEFLR